MRDKFLGVLRLRHFAIVKHEALPYRFAIRWGVDRILSTPASRGWLDRFRLTGLGPSLLQLSLLAEKGA